VELPLEEQRVMLADAHAEALQLGRLVDDLLLLARGDAGIDQGKSFTRREVPDSGKPKSSPPSWETLPIVEVDRELLQLVRGLRGRLRAEGPPADLEIGLIEPARVHADAETLRRVALILLDNAIKYTQVPRRAGEDTTSGHVARVSVSLYREAGQALLQVQDNGIGISDEDLPHIFERFYRADRSRDRTGTGLGLAIASGLVEQLGGKITAQSTVGIGSIFSVWLPLAVATRGALTPGDVFSD
jgi:two-component system OmpR family sensor kinase